MTDVNSGGLAVEGGISYGFASNEGGTSQEFSNGLRSNASTSSDTASHTDTLLVDVPTAPGASDWAASIDSWDADGLSLDITDASGVDRLGVAVLLIEDERLVDTEGVFITDTLATTVIANFSEDVFIADDAVLLASNVATNIALVTSESVAISDTVVPEAEDAQLELVASEDVLISDQFILDPTLAFSEDVFITERVRFFGSIVLSASETVSIADSALLITGTVFTASESVFIGDTVDFGAGLIMNKTGSGIGRTVFGGAALGSTHQGGVSRGGTYLG